MINQLSPEISIVIPLLNEESNLKTLYQRLKVVLLQTQWDYELLFVDDGSTDKSFDIIKSLHVHDDKVKGISLSRNFGHQIALTAGIEAAKGNYVAMLDADLQHPPEMLPEMFNFINEGFDIVNTRRKTTQKVSVFKKTSSKIYYRILNLLSDVPIEPDASDFRIMNRRATDAFLKLEERDRFIRGLISWVGFRQTIVYYEAPARYSGHTKYTLRKMFRFALDGITSLSAKPLRFSFYAGFFIFLLGIAYSVFAIVRHFQGETIKGWTSTMVTILIIGGYQLLSIGIVGEYIARIFNETKKRPVYFIKETT